MHTIEYRFAGGTTKYPREATVKLLRLNERTLEEEKDGQFTATLNYHRVNFDEHLNVEQQSSSSRRWKVKPEELEDFLEQGFRIIDETEK